MCVCVCIYIHSPVHCLEPLVPSKNPENPQPHHQNRQGFPVLQKRPAQGAPHTQPKRPRGCHDGSMRCSASLCSVPVLCNTVLVRYLPCSQPTMFPPSVLAYYCTSDQSRDHVPPPLCNTDCQLVQHESCLSCVRQACRLRGLQGLPSLLSSTRLLCHMLQATMS